MDDAGAHGADSNSSLEHALVGRLSQLLRWLDNQVGMSNMGRVIDRESKANDQIDDNDVVHSQIPEVDQSEQVQVDKQNCEHNKKRDGGRPCDEEYNEKDCHDGKTNTEGSFLDEYHILLHVNHLLRVRVCVSQSIFALNAANVLQILRTIFGKSFKSDGLS